MRIIAAVVIAAGLTMTLTWLPVSGTWWKVVRFSFYVPILLISTGGKYGPLAGLFAGVAASLLCAAVAASQGAGDVSLGSSLEPDFVLIGVFGGFTSSWPQWRQRYTAQAPDSWPALTRFSESEFPFDSNPLTSIESAARLLGEGDNPAELRQELVGIIVKECGHLSASISGLLQQVREAAPPQICEADITPIIDAALREAEFVLAGRGVILRQEIAPGVPPIDCNPDQIRYLLKSLMINAARSESGGTEVILDAQCKNNGVVLEVRAKGHAIRRITSRLFGSHPESSAVGLASVQDIVRRHGGRIGARINLTKGLEFSVWLPLRCGDPNGGWQGTGGGGR